MPADQGTLRAIAVTVTENAAGYRWRLVESPDGGASWPVLSSGRESHKTYQAAMAAGLLALQALCDDLAVGPRAEGADSEEGATDDAVIDAEPAGAPSRQRKAFGFGQLR